jgi:hypothetical protein
MRDEGVKASGTEVGTEVGTDTGRDRPGAARAARRRLWQIGVLAWLASLGVDFFLHGGVLAGLYVAPSPFLLSPDALFARIPAGYASFAVLTGLVLWLMVWLGLGGWRDGLRFGLQLGALLWGALALALWSSTTATPALLAGWAVGQTVELGVTGAVIGQGLAGGSLARLAAVVMAGVVLLIVATITLQTLGVAPTTRLSG